MTSWPSEMTGPQLSKHMAKYGHEGAARFTGRWVLRRIQLARIEKSAFEREHLSWPEDEARIAKYLQLPLDTMPPIVLRGNGLLRTARILDGNHRVWVARQLGATSILAYIRES